jgi:large subunit ribosomal protein L30
VDVAADRKPSASPRTISVTWARSTIGHTAAARGTIRALGLRRLNQTVQIADTPENRGMLRRVAFLLDVNESGTETSPSADREESSR